MKTWFMGALCSGAGLSFAEQAPIQPEKQKQPMVQTVTGMVSADELGLTLPHEHVMCDFIGADKVSRNRYNPDEIIATMLPYLNEAKGCGVRTFVDCTPAYLGRDPEVLRTLSQATGLHILTNTGFYKEPYLPKETWDISEDNLAERWISEITESINGTGIKAGFIKIAVNPGPLIPIQKKIVTAACLTHKATGAVIASHTVSGVAALEQLDILEREKVNPSRFIFVHAQGEKDMAFHIETARRGAWVEYDGVSSDSCEQHIKFVTAMLDKGFENSILISQDSGWYNIGEKNGGNIKGYSFLITEFLPLLRSNGVNEDTINKLTADNPARAFALGT